MSEQKNRIATRVEAIAIEIAKPFGIDIWDVRFAKEGTLWFLRIFLDKQDGITLDDCETISRAIDPILDEQDFIESVYYLEVCSPGLGRTLSKDWHFAKYMGESILIKLYKPLEGSKEYKGLLLSVTDTEITIQINDAPKTFTKNVIATVKLDDDKF